MLSHLTSSQKAVLALEVEKSLGVEAKEQQRQAALETNSKKEDSDTLEQIVAQAESETDNAASPLRREAQSRDKAAELVGTNRQYVSDAKKIAVCCQFGLVPTLTGGPRITSSYQGAAFNRLTNRAPGRLAKPSTLSVRARVAIM